MIDEQQPGDASDNKTEVIPAVTSGEGLPHTKELPVVEDEPTVLTPPPDRSQPSAEPGPVQAKAEQPPPPALPVAAAPIETPAASTPPASTPPASTPPASTPPASTPPAPPQPAPPQPSASPGVASSVTRRPVVLVALVAALVLVVVAGVVTLRDRGGNAASGSARSSSASGKLPATITSVDPSGGSGFRRDGTTWRTQTYTSADFGNLKDGVGLLLDLGASKTVGKVTFDVPGGPIAVELRAGDSATGSASGYQRLAADPSASGSTTLTVNGGAEHRYWLIWVTKLAPEGGGYRAVIQDPSAFAPRA